MTSMVYLRADPPADQTTTWIERADSISPDIAKASTPPRLPQPPQRRVVFCAHNPLDHSLTSATSPERHFQYSY
jgi:hypothetical protein